MNQLLIEFKILKNSKLSDVKFIQLINVKMSAIVGILTFMSRLKFITNLVEHEKSYITSRPGWNCLFSSLAEFHNKIH